MTKLDLDFNFTLDTKGYWDNYWDVFYGYSSKDPDTNSPLLIQYHKAIWSKELPCGKYFDLKSYNNYLTFKDFRLSSDSILSSFRYKKYEYMLRKIVIEIPNYRDFMTDYINRSSTIAGFIIFPKKRNSINQQRGVNHYICDRFDITLDCIRKYYLNEDSPLFNTLKDNKDFFDLFIDFKGYVDFFFLQDLVSPDYSKVNLWLETTGLHPFPKNTEEYIKWIKSELEFLEKRKSRIQHYLNR